MKAAIIVIALLSNSVAEEDKDSSNRTSSTFDKKEMLRHCGIYCNDTTLNMELSCTRVFPTCVNCYCDQFCTNYGDCCPDSDGNLPVVTNIPTFACIAVNHGEYTGSYLMKNTCDFENRTSLENMTTNKSSLQPVTSSKTGMVYFSAWYAHCNDDVGFTPWPSKTVCMEGHEELGDSDAADHVNTSDKSNSASVSCSQLFAPQDFNTNLRSCYPAYMYSGNITRISHCNATGIWNVFDAETERLCLTTYFPVITSELWFRNIYCYICNGLKVQYSDGCLEVPVVEDHDITNILNWNQPSSKTCYFDQWLDPVTDTCRWLTCPSGKYLLEGYCIDLEFNTTEIEYWFQAAFTLPTVNGSKVYSYENLESMVFDSVARIFSNQSAKVFEVRMKTYSSKYTNQETLSVICVFLTLVSTNKTLFEETMMNSIYGDWYLQTNNTVFLLQSEFYDTEDETNSTIARAYILDQKTGECCRPLSLESKLSEMDSALFSSTIVTVMLNHVPYCPYVTLNQSEFTITDNVVSLSYASVNFTDGTYVKKHSELMVCRDVLLALYQSLTFHQEMKPEDIVSFVCTCFSLFCLALTFITFCTFSELRTLPTKNNMFLVMSLFLAQGLFQFSYMFKFNATVCSCVGLLVHLLWLTVLLWMNVCSFNMFYVFVIFKMLTTSFTSQNRLLKRYIGYVYGTAASIVICNIAVHASRGLGIGYGGPLCYMTSGTAVLIAFVGPLGLILIANVAFFSITIYRISKVKEIKRQTGMERNNIFIYVKLSTLTGVQWLVAILALLLESTPLKYVAIVLNASQGVFLFISFVANRRTLALWRSLCVMPSNEPSSAETTTKTSTV